MVSPTSRPSELETASCTPDVGFLTSDSFQLLLGEAINKVDELGEGFLAAKDRLLSLQNRFEEGRFHLAVLGQFKRGKSYLAERSSRAFAITYLRSSPDCYSYVCAVWT